MADKIISQNLLHQMFEYKNGDLYRKITTSSRSLKGCKAGYLRNDGYFMTQINHKNYLNHRLIYMMFYGYMPEFLDHIDGNPLNNCIENLREATITQNNFNTKIKNSNTSGYKNVYWEKRCQKWLVKISANKKEIHIGRFDNIDDAIINAQKARSIYHGRFARHI